MVSCSLYYEFISVYNYLSRIGESIKAELSKITVDDSIVFFCYCGNSKTSSNSKLDICPYRRKEF